MTLYGEADVLCDREERIEVGLGHLAARLHQKELPLRPQKGVYLLQEATLVGGLM